MAGSAGANMVLRLHQLYSQKRFDEAKWQVAELNNLPVRATKGGTVVDFYGNEHNLFVKHITFLSRHMYNCEYMLF